MKKGLVLEGGAMRGMFTAGVLDVLMENGVAFDGIVGVSAGAAFGCNYKSHQIGRALRYNKRFCADKRYCSVRSLITSGNIYNADFCYREVPVNYDPFDFDAYVNDPCLFYAVCTDLETGKAVYHLYGGKEDEGFEWIRASASMPLVSQIVEIKGQKLLDGGIADSVPIRFFEGEGYTKNVVILTQPKGYRKKKNPLMPIARLKYGKYPRFVKAMANRHTVYNETLEYVARQEESGALLAIYPKIPLPLKKMEKAPEKLQLVYDMGKAAAKERLDEIKRYLNA